MDEHGKVAETIVLKGVPNTGLDEAATESIKAVAWSPAQHEGKNVGVWISVPVNFKLK